MDGDAISREALKEKAIWTKVNNGAELIDIEVVPLDAIDNAPPVEPEKEIIPVCNVTFDKDQLQEIVDKAIKGLQWIPITMRPIEEDEKIDFPDATFMFDCPMPENGEEILITTKYGVEFDTCYNDDGYYLDSNRSWDEVLAWMPLPEAYKKGNDSK